MEAQKRHLVDLSHRGRGAALWVCRAGQGHGALRGCWDATVTATRLDDDTIIVERVSFDEAKAALEQHAAQHATWM